MIEFIAVAIFVALVWYFLKLRKSTDTSKNAPESVKPKSSKPIDKVVATPTESVTAPVDVSPAPAQSVAVESEPVISEVIVEADHGLLPQDSTLKRHYLTHVRAMVTSISPTHPTDSALARHYDTQINADIERYLSDATTMEQLVDDYAAIQKTLTSTAIKPQIITPVAVVIEEALVEEPQTIIADTQIIVDEAEVRTVIADVESVVVTPSIPEDATLRRHFITHLYAQVADSLLPRPTDSTLRRHYDSLLENAVSSLLSQ